MKKFNYHTHSIFCDGQRSPEQHVFEAIEKGMEQIGFSSHAPLPFPNSWSMDPDEMPIYVKTVQELKKAYKGKIEVLLSLEIDYIPGWGIDFGKQRKELGLDYVIGAVHLIPSPGSQRGAKNLWFIDGPFDGYEDGLVKLFNEDARLAVETYYKQVAEMAIEQKPDIIAHFDKVKMNNKGRFFLESDKWYIKAVQNALEAIKEAGSILEVNTRGLYRKKCRTYFPSPEILNMALEMGIPVTLSSDAHQPAEAMALFSELCEDLTAIGFESVKVYQNGKWVDEALD